MADITPSDSNNYTAPVPPSGDLLKLMGIEDFVVEVATGNILQPTLTTEQEKEETNFLINATSWVILIIQ